MGCSIPTRCARRCATPTLLVSVMAVNNETGVIQDIPGLAAITKEAGALFHSDLAQAVGKIPLDLTAWKVDLASVSGHKLYGPKGVGALFVRRRPRVRLSPLFSGGGQETGAAIRHLADAADRRSWRSLPAGRPGNGHRGRTCRSTARQPAGPAEADIPGIRVNGARRPRIAGNLNLTFPRATAAD